MIEAGAWTLIHFLWQGALVWILVLVHLQFFRRASTRYVVSCLAMLLMLALPVVTFMVLTGSGDDSLAATETTSFIPASTPSVTRLAEQIPTPPTVWMPLLVSMWASGVGLFSFRSAGGLMLAYLRGRRAQLTLPPECQQAAERLAARLGLRRAVQLRVSLTGFAPSVVGWMKPVLLVPAAALRLPMQQLEALIAHEFAHIRRHDFLINLLQNAVETLLFYHPAVWWLGRRIREERENCCDDLAVAVCGDRVVYARALTSLEELRTSAPDFAMAASGGSLVKRIARLLGKGEPAVYGSSIWLVSALAVCGIAILVGTVMSAEERVPSQESAPPEPVVSAAPIVESSVSRPVERPRTVRPQNLIAQAQTQPQTTPPAPGTSTQGYIGEIAAAGFPDLSIDDLIAFKIHGITGDYIRSVQATGFKPTADQLVAMKIHNVTAEYAQGLKSSGFANLSIDDLIAGRIHGVTPDSVKQLQATGVPVMTFDDVVAARIHGLNADFVREMQNAGFPSLKFDDLIAARIHGVDTAAVRELRNLGLGELTFDDVIAARVHGINAEFVRKVQQAGLKNLTFDKIIQLKIHRVIE